MVTRNKREEVEMEKKRIIIQVMRSALEEAIFEKKTVSNSNTTHKQDRHKKVKRRKYKLNNNNGAMRKKTATMVAIDLRFSRKTPCYCTKTMHRLMRTLFLSISLSLHYFFTAAHYYLYYILLILFQLCVFFIFMLYF